MVNSKKFLKGGATSYVVARRIMKRFLHENKKRIVVCLVVLALILFFSFYLAGLMQSVFSTELTVTWGVFHMIGNAARVGFPTALFLVFFLILLFLCGALLWGLFRETKSSDVLGRKFWQPKNRQSYGDAHFEEPYEYADVADVKPADKEMGVICGQLTQDGSRVVGLNTKRGRGNAHTAVFGASGSGKSYTFTIPFCYQAIKRRESIIITDPDGGLEKQLAGLFISNGYIKRTLNLKNLEKSDGWDCLKSVRLGNMDTNSQIFAHTCIANVMEAGAKKDIYFTGPMSLLRALVLRTLLDSSLPDDQKTIKTAYNLLQQPDEEMYLASLFDETTMTDEEKKSLPPYRSFLLTSDRLTGNLIANLAIMLQVLQSEDVSRVLSTDDIDLILPGLRPCVYFCQFPDDHSTYQFVVSLFFSMLSQSLLDYADARPDGKLPVTVNFLLDEFPNIGVLPDWARKMSIFRKRNINVTMIFQSLSQLMNLYQESWDTILGNCGTWISLGINDNMTAETIQKRVGTTTIAVQTEQHDAEEPIIDLFGHRYNTGEGKRDLLSLDELLKMDEDHALIFFQNHNPVLAFKFPHVLHPYSKLLCDDPLGPMPPIENAAARKERRAREQAYLDAYYEKHKDDKPPEPEPTEPDKPATTGGMMDAWYDKGEAVCKKIAAFCRKAYRWCAGKIKAARGKPAEAPVLRYEPEEAPAREIPMSENPPGAQTAAAPSATDPFRQPNVEAAPVREAYADTEAEPILEIDVSDIRETGDGSVEIIGEAHTMEDTLDEFFGTQEPVKKADAEVPQTGIPVQPAENKKTRYSAVDDYGLDQLLRDEPIPRRTSAQTEPKAQAEIPKPSPKPTKISEASNCPPKKKNAPMPE